MKLVVSSVLDGVGDQHPPDVRLAERHQLHRPTIHPHREWRGQDSNLRRTEPTGLQPVPVDRLGTPPGGRL